MAVSSGRAVAYVRVSTAEQSESGLGIEAQVQSIKGLASRLQVEVVETFTDAGLSGGLPVEQRPGLLAAIDALQPGDLLLAHKRDRVARDVVLAALAEKLVQRRGGRIVTTDAPDDDSPSAVLMKQILDAFGQFERALIRARTKSAMAAARARGRRTGHVPWGRQLASDGIHLEPNQEELQLLEKMKWHRCRGWSLHDIAQMLNDSGLRNRQGRPWQSGFVAQLLERHSGDGLESPLRNGSE